MLRNLNETLSDGRRVMGSPFQGLTGQEIIDTASTGTAGPGCLYTAGLTPSARYRLLIESHDLGADFLLLENGAGQAYRDGASVYGLLENNSPVAASMQNRTITIGTPAPPQFLVNPQSGVVISGGTMTLMSSVIGSPTPTLQWRRNGVAIPGEVGPNYTLANVQLSDNGAQFTVVATNASGIVSSLVAVLTVALLPSLTTQPQSASRYAGQTVTLSCSAVGSPPLAYQWSKNGAPIIGANAATYMTPALVLGDTGSSFTVAVSNVYGTAVSSAALITVTEAPVAASITANPTNYIATEGGTALFEVTAAGSLPVSYQWYRNNQPLPGEVYRTLLLSSVLMTLNGSTFHCEVSNAYGSATSTQAALTVTPLAVAPTILVQPLSMVVNEGAIATFTVGATGSSPMTYQWRRNGVDIPGATLPSYTMDAALVTDTGAQFSVFMQNAAGTATSQVAVLTVIDLPEPTEYPLDFTQWPAGRVIRPSRNGFTAWPLNFGDVDFFAFDFSSEFGQTSDIASATVTMTPFFPVVGAIPASYRDGAPNIHGSFVVQRLNGNAGLGRFVVRCTAVSQSGRKVTLECTLYVLQAGQGFIR